MICNLGSRCLRTGALVNSLMGLRKADSASGDQMKGEQVEVSWVTGAATLL